MLLEVHLESPADRVRIRAHRQHNRSAARICYGRVHLEVLRQAGVVQLLAAQPDTVDRDEVIRTVVDLGARLVRRNDANAVLKGRALVNTIS